MDTCPLIGTTVTSMRPQRALLPLLLLSAACASKPYNAENDGLSKCGDALDQHAGHEVAPKSLTSGIVDRTLTVNYFVSSAIDGKHPGQLPDYVCTARLGKDKASTTVLTVRP